MMMENVKEVKGPGRSADLEEEREALKFTQVSLL
jgi:hypothetical protein